ERNARPFQVRVVELVLRCVHISAQLLRRCKKALVHPVVKSNRLSLANKPSQSFSQCGEDLIVSFILDSLGISKPSYLDIGTHHPTHLNNTYLFYVRGGRGVCVEPNTALFAKIKKARRRDKCLNVGVGFSEEKESDFFMISSDTLSTLSRQRAEGYQNNGNQEIVKVVRIPMVQVNDVIREHFRGHPNFVSLDIEGVELPVLRTFDFSRFRPEVFCIETLTYSENRSERKIPEIADLMHSKGYFTYADTYINTIFVDKQAWLSRE
ncbi:MAG: FkbM family methyltransferase, partial [Chloroflexi bacterium]|nr:FkbM family methyltransferase [Chloroflexota bacterium]